MWTLVPLEGVLSGVEEYCRHKHSLRDNLLFLYLWTAWKAGQRHRITQS